MSRTIKVNLSVTLSGVNVSAERVAEYLRDRFDGAPLFDLNGDEWRPGATTAHVAAIEALTIVTVDVEGNPTNTPTSNDVEDGHAEDPNPLLSTDAS